VTSPQNVNRMNCDGQTVHIKQTKSLCSMCSPSGRGCKLKDVGATAWSLHRWTSSCWKCSHSLIRRNFSWSTLWIRLHMWYTRSCSFPPNLVINTAKGKVR